MMDIFTVFESRKAFIREKMNAGKIAFPKRNIALETQIANRSTKKRFDEFRDHMADAVGYALRVILGIHELVFQRFIQHRGMNRYGNINCTYLPVSAYDIVKCFRCGHEITKEEYVIWHFHRKDMEKLMAATKYFHKV